MASLGMIEIPYETVDKFYKLGKVGVDALSLYIFYQKFSIQQNNLYGVNNRPYATREFCKKGLHWSTDRYQAAKNLLVEEKMAKNRVVRNKKGQVKHIVELPFINYMSSSKDKKLEKELVLQNHPMEKKPTNTDSSSNSNTDGIFANKKNKTPTNKRDNTQTLSSYENAVNSGNELMPAHIVWGVSDIDGEVVQEALYRSNSVATENDLDNAETLERFASTYQEKIFRSKNDLIEKLSWYIRDGVKNGNIQTDNIKQ